MLAFNSIEGAEARKSFLAVVPLPSLRQGTAP